MKIGASFLGSKNIPKVLEKLNVTDVDYIHVDVMDGKYVKNKTMALGDLLDITYYTRKRLDVHLMVQRPLKYIETLATLNVEFINVHLDIKNDLETVINRCKEYGIKVGIAINPDQDIEKVYPYLDKIDLVLVMGVVPGKSGQEFIPETPLKVKKIKQEIEKQKRSVLVSVDGGINFLTAKDLKEADILVSGSTIVKSDNYQETITKLRKCASN